MIGFLTSLLLRAGVAPRFARASAVVGLTLATLALVTAAWRCSVSDAVADREAAARAAAMERARNADQAAAVSARADDARQRDERRQLERIPADARPLSDNERAFLRCIRLQQQARADGRPAPAC